MKLECHVNIGVAGFRFNARTTTCRRPARTTQPFDTDYEHPHTGCHSKPLYEILRLKGDARTKIYNQNRVRICGAS
jgi:hypothetical protein